MVARARAFVICVEPGGILRSLPRSRAHALLARKCTAPERCSLPGIASWHEWLFRIVSVLMLGRVFLQRVRWFHWLRWNLHNPYSKLRVGSAV